MRRDPLRLLKAALLVLPFAVVGCDDSVGSGTAGAPQKPAAGSKPVAEKSPATAKPGGSAPWRQATKASRTLAWNPSRSSISRHTMIRCGVNRLIWL